jgi:hypothetical protein
VILERKKEVFVRLLYPRSDTNHLEVGEAGSNKSKKERIVILFFN